MTVDVTERLSQKRLAAKRDLAKQGLYLPNQPKFKLPKVPITLTDWSDRGVMRLFVQLTRFLDYVQAKHVEAQIDEISAESRLEVTKARRLVGNWDGSSADRVAIAKAHAILDDEVVQATDVLIQCKAKSKLYGVFCDTLTRDIAVVSREVTRRVGSADVERRAAKFGP